MKRLLTLASVALMTALMTAGNASAAPPGAGCPPGFELTRLGPGEISGKIIDLHGDEMVCLKVIRPGYGVFFDNVVP